MTEQNTHLAATAYGAGVLTAQDFAIFQDHGYKGLYNGETARDIAARKGLKRNQKILDWMGSEELAANLFRATQAEAQLRREGVTDKGTANQVHHDVGSAVRRFIIEDLGARRQSNFPRQREASTSCGARSNSVSQQSNNHRCFHR